MIDNKKVAADLRALLGDAKVLDDQQSRETADGYLTRPFEKSFGYVPEHLPICVVKATCTDDVAKTHKYCNENGVTIVPKTGATGSEDGILVVNDTTVMLDCYDINEVISIDEVSMIATVGAGVRLNHLEELCNKKGLTTGHCPQSQPLACMGGLVATRSIGQFSTYYGGIEDLVTGLEAVLPSGEVIRIRNVPRRAAGPDLRHLFIGCEGALATITEVSVKLFRYYPESFWKGAFVVPSFEDGLDALQEIMTSGYRPSVVRLYDKADMDLNYGSVELAEGEACMFFVCEGPPEISQGTGSAIARIAEKYKARFVGTKIVDHWLATRNNVCDTYGRKDFSEECRQTKVFYATCEISATWGEIKNIYHSVMENLPEQFGDKLVVLGGHVSHSYQTGTNIYFIYKLKSDDWTRFTEYEQWPLINAFATEVLKQSTGGVAHHHGLGKSRVRIVDKELGSSYVLMKGLKKMMDPNGIMNPGALVKIEK